MSPKTTIYPQLSRYFNTTTDLANAACMKRMKLWRILQGEQEFTPQEKRAIVADIIARMSMGEIEQTEQVNIETLRSIYDHTTNFEEFFKIGG